MASSLKRPVFGTNQTNILKKRGGSVPYADRFVSRRAGIDYQAAKSKIFSDNSSVEADRDVFKQDPYSWPSRGYINLLDSTLKNYEPESRILNLTSEDTKYDFCRTKQENNKGKIWNCFPRKRPVIGQPDIIFDLPGYVETMHNDILDWGKKDLLLAALNNQIFMWHTPSNNVLTLHDFGEDNILVTKFDPTGTYIAVGTFFGLLYIIDIIIKKIMPVPWQYYKAKKDDNQPITAIAWSTDGVIACCTSSGSVTLHDSRMKCIRARLNYAHIGDILAAQFSPDEQFLVTCGMDCLVRLWSLPHLMLFFEIVYGNPPRAVAWHPWRGCQLAVGGGNGVGKGLGDGSLSVWDVARQTNLCHRLPTVPCAVDAIAWSTITAELVVSYWLEGVYLGNDEEPGHSRLLVLSSPWKVTDELCSPLGRTRALLFNPDGSKIASASSFESLFIWNFLGKPGPLLNMYKRKIKKQDSYHNFTEINEFNNFGMKIR